MDRAAALWELVRDDVAYRASAFASLLLLWLAIAWVDPRFLPGIPLAFGAAAGYRRLRPAAEQPYDDCL